MGYQRIPFNTTILVKGKGNVLTGSNDAIFLRNRYQMELDNSHTALVNMVHYIEEQVNEAKCLFHKANSLKIDIEAHLEERENLYLNLNTLLNKETKFEFDMWLTTQQNKKNTQVNIKQKFNDSDVDEIKFDSMLEYIKQYPVYVSKSSFKDLLDQIKSKEKEIRVKKEFYNNAVSEYNCKLSILDKEFGKTNDKLMAYNRIFNEGNRKLNGCRYNRSILYRLSSEKTKSNTTLDTLSHRIEQFTNTLNLLQGQYMQYKSNMLIEMSYKN